MNVFAPIAIGMNNHIHLPTGRQVWQMMGGIKPQAVKRDFMKYTAQKIKQNMIKNYPAVLTHFKVAAKDREYPRLTRRAGVLEKKYFKCRIKHYRDAKTRVGIHSL